MVIPEQLIIFSLFFPVLYAETHYRFRYFFSWLKKSEPEILVDIPSRIQKRKQLPILLIVKDANRYKTEIIDIRIFKNNSEVYAEEIKTVINLQYFDKIFYIETSNFETGYHYFDIRIRYKIKGKIKTCFNDNHRGTKHKPLPVYISEDPLPNFGNCVFGETHSHTNYTSDQLEFGASLKSTSILAKSMGLNFFCATDHSYDLDDEENNYLKNDESLPKWNKFLNEVDLENKKQIDFMIIGGEEASLHNHRNKNIHCLIYNSKKFYPGNGDSGEKWLHPFSEFTIEDVLNDVDENTLVFAAHPVEPVPFLQRILIRRDNWHAEDCKHPRLNGLQFANGGPNKYFKQGKKLWINLLLKGHNLVGLAGNDAHGNFARYRQVSFPFLKMKENYFHLFGNWRTGVYLNSNELNTDNILNSIKKGNCFLTNGPALQFQASSNSTMFHMGSECKNITGLYIKTKSTEEFGRLKSISIVKGIPSTRDGEESEQIIFQKILKESVYNFENEVQLKETVSKGYYRCEVQTDLNKTALSNPIWYSDIVS